MANPYDAVSPAIQTGLSVFQAMRGDQRAQQQLQAQEQERQTLAEERQYSRKRQGLADTAAAEQRTYERGRQEKADAREEQNRARTERQNLLAAAAITIRTKQQRGEKNIVNTWKTPEMAQWVQAEDMDPESPEFASLLAGRHPEAWNRGVGEKLDHDIKTPDGTLIPKDSVTISKVPARLVPSKDEKNPSYHALLKVTARPPGAPEDGSGDLVYYAPRTEGSSAKLADKKLKTIGAEDMIRGQLADRMLMEFASDAPDDQVFLDRITQAYVGEGGDLKKLEVEDSALKQRKGKAEVEKAEEEVKLTRARIGTEGAHAAYYRQGRGTSGTGAGDTAEMKNIKFIARVMFNAKDDDDKGAQAKAARWIRTESKDKSRQERVFELAKDIAKNNRENRYKPGDKEYIDPQQGATSMVNSIFGQPETEDDDADEDTGDAADFLPQPQPRQAAPRQTPKSQYREGQTARNPKTGERIIFRGGQWTPANG